METDGVFADNYTTPPKPDISIATLLAAHVLGHCKIVEVTDIRTVRRKCICPPPKDGMIFRDPSCMAHGAQRKKRREPR
jgi:hypothetical protein